MQLLLDIKDDRASFVLEVLRYFKFVKTEEITIYEADVLAGIKDAVEEMKRIKAGKLKSRPIEELINEL